MPQASGTLQRKLRINTKPRRQNSHKADLTRRCPGHLQWVRGRPCLLAGERGCFGKVEAAHVDHAGGKGMALKVSDFDAVPLCQGHHRELHDGRISFETRHSIDLIDAAKVYAFRSPHRIKRDQRLAREARA